MRDPDLGAKKSVHPYAWLWESLESIPSFELRSMFGVKTAYVEGKIMLGFAARREPWRGLLVCTDKTQHASLIEEFPALAPHPVIPKWLMLAESEDDFERVAGQLVTLVLRLDPRIGVAPSPRRNRKAPVSRKQSRALLPLLLILMLASSRAHSSTSAGFIRKLAGVWTEAYEDGNKVVLRRLDGTFSERAFVRYDIAKPPVEYQATGHWTVKRGYYVTNLNFISIAAFKNALGKNEKEKITDVEGSVFRYVSTDNADVEEHRIGEASDALFNKTNLSPPPPTPTPAAFPPIGPSTSRRGAGCRH